MQVKTFLSSYKKHIRIVAMQVKTFLSSYKKYIVIVALIGAFTLYSVFIRFLPQFELFSFLAGLLLLFVTIIFFVEFIQLEKELKTVVRSQEVVNDIIAHDLSNIVQGLSGSLELLNSNLATLDPQQIILMSTAIAQANTLKETIRNINKLIWLRKTTDIELKLEDVSLSRYLFQEISQIRHTFEKGLNIKFSVDLSEPFMVKARPEDIADIFRIILINAIKFTIQPKILIDTSIESYKDMYWKVRISDAGIGVPDVNKQKIFLRFEEGKPEKGSGVGLALAKTIVEKYQGKIWVEDRVKGDYKQGASFITIFPKTRT
ncbi:MAG: sensor histidine kinase [Promethearchaeota archaeon]